MSNEGIFDKVKDFIKGHPDQADQGLGKAEQLVDERTGGKYSEQIGKGDDMVRQQLGVPDDQAATGTMPTTPGTDPDVAPAPTPEVPTPPSTPEPIPTPNDPGTSQPPVPGPDPVPTSSPETVPEAAPESMPEAVPDTNNEASRG